MTKEVKLIPVGDEIGFVVPHEVLAELGLRQGDSLTLDLVPGGIALKAGDNEFERQMAIARRIMREDHAVLRALAK